ncbi:MAG: metalloregulator ArsR/SmtB family transcription factor [Gammaproteobacteria bacterium]|nr:metalloregulator ArsR/SmtB family transcription factor [Gammaproteobacteria bacterium]
MNAEKVANKQTLISPEAKQMSAHAGDAADLMKALGNESRLMILCMLADGERSVGDLNEIIPLSQSALSQQLARLRTQGLVKTRRESQTIHYSLADGPADRVIRLLHDIYCGARLAAEKEKH